MKKTFILLFSTLFYITYCAKAQVTIGSQSNHTIKVDYDINFFNTPGTGTLTLQNMIIETTGTITFTNANIILNHMQIKANNIVFGNTVNNISTSKEVELDCNSLTFPAATGAAPPGGAPAPLIPVNLRGSGTDAKLSIKYRIAFTNATNYSMPSGQGLSIEVNRVL